MESTSNTITDRIQSDVLWRPRLCVQCTKF